MNLKEIKERNVFDKLSVFVWVFWKEEHVGEGCVHDVWMFARHHDKVKPLLATVTPTPERNVRLLRPLRTSVGLDGKHVQRHSKIKHANMYFCFEDVTIYF